MESLKLEGARREAILASMVEGVLAVDKDLRVTFCNHSFARTVGARLPVIPGMPLLELVRDPGLREIMTTVLATGERVEQRLTLPAAGAHSFEVLAGPLGASATRGALAILHDVTELERLERVRKDFVANVSHELRTPLAAIRGYAETLLDGALEDLREQPALRRDHPGASHAAQQHRVRSAVAFRTGVQRRSPRRPTRSPSAPRSNPLCAPWNPPRACKASSCSAKSWTT